jgi:hypothetical protein
VRHIPLLAAVVETMCIAVDVAIDYSIHRLVGAQQSRGYQPLQLVHPGRNGFAAGQANDCVRSSNRIGRRRRLPLELAHSRESGLTVDLRMQNSPARSEPRCSSG